ncbi:MAG: DUF3068 domain-containing protein [Candidatus Nanopelagicales bacterium]
MKRVFGLILLGLGFMLIVLAPLFRFYVGPSAAVAPLDQYTVSEGVGVAVKQLDIAKFAAGDANPYFPANTPITNTRYTRGDVLAADQDPAKSDGLAVYDTFSRTNAEDGRLITASQSRYAFGQTDSQLANCCGANVAGKTVNFSGIMPLKFPFFLKEQSYDIWDDQLQATAPAVFEAKEDHGGVSSYRFTQAIPPTQVPGSEQKVPAKIVKLPGSGDVTISQYYENTTTFWVEPLTGQIVDTAATPTVTFRGPGGTVDLATALQVKASASPAYLEQAAKDINAKASQLNLVMNVLPIVFLILGIILVVIGWLMAKSGAKTKEATAVATSGAPPAA